MRNMKPTGEPVKPMPPLKAWSVLGASLLLIWAFAFVVGPWIEVRIDTMHKIVQTIEAQSINANGYFYSDIEAAYQGEKYLREAIEFGAAEKAGLTFPLSAAFCPVWVCCGSVTGTCPCESGSPSRASISGCTI